MSRHALLAQLLLVAAHVRGGGPYPELGVRKQWQGFICYNQGARIFGELYPFDKIRYFGNNGADALGDINGDRKLDAIKEQGVFLGHGDGIFGTLTTALQKKPGKSSSSLTIIPDRIFWRTLKWLVVKIRASTRDC